MKYKEVAILAKKKLLELREEYVVPNDYLRASGLDNPEALVEDHSHREASLILMGMLFAEVLREEKLKKPSESLGVWVSKIRPH